MRVHLLNTEAPIREGNELEAMCHATVPNAKAVFLFEDGMSFPQTLIICSRCCEQTIGDGYLYAIVPGQETIQ